MHLRHLRVENFRSLRELELDLVPSTALFGENDAGVALLLDALALALGAGADERSFAWSAEDLRRGERGEESALCVALELEPSHPEEWRAELHDPLRRALLGERAGSEALRFEVRARKNGARQIASRFVFRSSSGDESDDPALLGWLRAAMPVFDLSRGLLRAAERAPRAAKSSDGAPRREPLEALRKSFRQWLSAQPTLDDARWEELFPRIEQIWDELQRHLTPVASTSPWLSSDFDLEKGTRRDERTGSLPVETNRGGRLGLLLLMGALAQRPGPPLHPESSPLIVAGDLEAQLHPTTRFAVMGFLLRLRAQVVFSTNSSQVLSQLPLDSLRRIVRYPERSRSFQATPKSFSRDLLRKVRYHLLMRHPEALLARAWLLVEGETEAWLLPQLARHLDCDFALEGIAVIEYAQCGVPPLLRLAESLRIEWHLLSDGDEAGEGYARVARELARGNAAARVSELPERDVETSFWRYGYAAVLQRLAGPTERRPRESEPAFARRVIRRAIERHSKPQVALRLIQALGAARSPGVPPPLARAIRAIAELAREQPLLEPEVRAPRVARERRPRTHRRTR